MKLSYNWLSDYLNLDNIQFSELVKKVNLHISETEADYQLVTPTLLEIGYVLDCKQILESDHLHLCEVKLIDGVKQIVCGAKNIKTGLYVIVAKPGAKFSNFNIRETFIKGYKSEGMICSLEELGIPKHLIPDLYKDGIYYFPEKPLSSNPYEALFLDDKIIELDLTPNRSDLLSVRGCAYDFSAIFNLPLKLKDIKPNFKVSSDYKIKVNTKKCLSYTLTTLDVKVSSSPLFIQERLIAAGIKPQNNIIDITNYVMIEYDTPNHAYDLEKLDKEISIVDNINSEFTAIDGKKYEIVDGDLAICSNKPVALAGIIGAKESEITDKTSKILLEFASFDPITVRKTSKRLGLITEASKRFERKIDQNIILEASAYCVSLLEQYANAKVLTHNEVIHQVKEPIVKFSVTKFNQFSGLSLTTSEIKDIFDAYHFSYTLSKDTFKVTIPSRRMDLEPHFQDLAEEVLRYIGFYKLPETLPKLDFISTVTPKEELITRSNDYFRGVGFNEVTNYSLVQEKKALRFKEELIKVLMPLTEDRAVMRPSLSMSLLDNVMYNRSYGNNDLFLFEVSNVYFNQKEKTYLAAVATGSYLSSNINSKEKLLADYFYLKGILENYFLSIGVKPEFRRKEKFHPLLNNFNSSDIYLNDIYIGYIGEVCPVVQKVYNLDMTIFLEVDLDILLDNVAFTTYKPVNNLPIVKRDLAFVVNREIDSYSLVKFLNTNIKNFSNLVDLKISDVYKLNDNENSIMFSFKFQGDHTLSSQEVDDVILKIIEDLKSKFNISLRAN